MSMTLGATLKEQTDEMLALAHGGAQRSVRAWGRAVSEHGSLLQSWIRGREVRIGERYPDPDITDRRHGSQFFYHSHRHGSLEHGHVHLFHHASVSGRRRYVIGTRNPWKRSAPSHLFGIGLDNRGMPVSLFTVNLWVTDGYWFDAATTYAMAKRFRVSDGEAHQASSEWLTGFVAMYLPLIERLLQRRDKALARAQGAGGMSEALQDRRREVMSTLRIDWLRDVEALEAELARRR